MVLELQKCTGSIPAIEHHRPVKPPAIPVNNLSTKSKSYNEGTDMRQ